MHLRVRVGPAGGLVDYELMAERRPRSRPAGGADRWFSVGKPISGEQRGLLRQVRDNAASMGKQLEAQFCDQLLGAPAPPADKSRSESVTIPSNMDPGLIVAYRETHYRVLATPEFTLHVDVPSADLADLHRSHGVDCSAFVTAWNPFSRSLDDASNAARQDELCKTLRRQGSAFVEGVGIHPTNGWPGEPSLLVLALTRLNAEALGNRLEQNAIVWSGADACPRLILLR